MDQFMKNSSFSSKEITQLDWPSQNEQINYRNEYQMYNPNERFQREVNKKRLYGQQRQYSPLETESYKNYREQMKNINKNYEFDQKNVKYEQRTMTPKEKLQELKNIIQAQYKFKEKRLQFQKLNRQFKLMQFNEISHSLEYVNNKKNDKNQQQNNLQENYQLSWDWARKKKSPQGSPDTYHRVIEQKEEQFKKINRVKQIEKKPRNYDIINFIAK